MLRNGAFQFAEYIASSIIVLALTVVSEGSQSTFSLGLSEEPNKHEIVHNKPKCNR